MNHNKLNQKIYPLYGDYKKSLNSIKSYKSLMLWSKIGKYINDYLDENPELTKSKLFRDMYGKGEGIENIEKRGYISREFLQRAHRVYLMELNNQLNIQKELSSINTLAPFREAMPFFDNKKYIFKGEKRVKLLKLLNSGLSPSIIIKRVKELQKENINISNPRTQRLNDLKPEVEIFINSYNSIFKNYKSKNYNSYIKEDKNNIILLSKYLQCLTAEDFVIPEEKIIKFFDKDFNDLKRIIDFLYKKKDAKIRRRFRRLIPIARIRQLSTYIFSIAKDMN